MDDEEIIEFIKKRIKKVKLEEMNKELREWMKEHEISIDEKEEEEEKIEGDCQICEKRDAKYRCIRCGKQVCISCYWTMLGICKDCISEEKMKELKEHYF
ncbi:MAG TPA: hypothetical protein ENI33_01220 [Thermoplasmatales archaeon]|nr:hypothetical protein [Thermoplasmatales archaeon]